MQKNPKPVRKCHACLLNMGDRCWHYEYPRGQWRGKKACPGLDNEQLHHEFIQWKKQPTVKTRQEIRRDFFRTKLRPVVRRQRKGRSS